ncbi:VIT1/CCC1 transporter family protein [Candidatus Woesearchaeota archaeon]|nr:VIT1/CCC1 transporter family protein [Candidatus Woesearchaeota archaeon]
MSKKRGFSNVHVHRNSFLLRDIILGGQDGLVNILALVLGVAGASLSQRIVLISGLAATFAESIAMAAVAYTSSKAAWEYYKKMIETEKEELRKVPHLEKKEIEQIYRKKGFRGTLLSKIVSKITSSKRVWLDTMMTEELKLFPKEYSRPEKNAFVVGFSSLIGSLIPLAPFVFFAPVTGIYVAFFASITALFITGAIKAKITVGDWKKSGFEMALIGTIAAVAGYLIGLGLGRLI